MSLNRIGPLSFEAIFHRIADEWEKLGAEREGVLVACDGVGARLGVPHGNAANVMAGTQAIALNEAGLSAKMVDELGLDGVNGITPAILGGDQRYANVRHASLRN